MIERGEYRAIRRVLLDGPDFQRLPERARWVFIALKLNLGPSGIEVWYPAELVARLSGQTGTSPAGVQDALITLEREGWIERETNVVWIVRQLEHEPNVKLANPKHRTMIQSHTGGLPRLDIVARFVMAYEPWFRSDGTQSGTQSDHLRWAYDRVSDRVSDGVPKASRITEDKTENKTESLGSSGDDPVLQTLPTGYPREFEATWLVYPPRTGGNPKKEAFQAWRARLRSGVPVEVLHAGVERYAAFMAAEGKLGSRFVMQGATFFGSGEHYLEPYTIAAAPSSNGAPRTLRATEMLLT
jgi:hypothetical protein